MSFCFMFREMIIWTWTTIQLTNGIPWNGKFYNRDVIKVTITRAKGEGYGHFYHIEVINLPFHRIPFVSCFISLIEHIKKMNFYWKITSKIGMIFEVKTLLGSLFLARCVLRSFCCAAKSCAHIHDNARCLSSQYYASILRTQWSF